MNSVFEFIFLANESSRRVFRNHNDTISGCMVCSTTAKRLAPNTARIFSAWKLVGRADDIQHCRVYASRRILKGTNSASASYFRGGKHQRRALIIARKKVFIIAVLVLLLGQVAGDGLDAYAHTDTRIASGVPGRIAESGHLIDERPHLESIVTGAAHSCAQTAEGGVKCWGDNMYYQVGHGTDVRQLKPVDVSGLASGVTTLAAGSEHTCALMEGGGVKCWGFNASGQLGDGTTEWKRNTPVNVSELSIGVLGLAAGGGHTCALTASAGVMCWGDNYYGQLGDGTDITRSTPVNVTGLTNGAIALAAGGGHTCALTTSGGTKCWGSNYFGALGDGTGTDRSTPVDVTGLASGVLDLAAGWRHTCALVQGGGVKCWGSNEFGQLGDGSTTDRSTPVNVIGLANGATAVAAGGGHTCALMEGGGVKCWGYNASGQLGDGTTTDRSTPVNVAGLDSGVVDLAAGSLHTCALMEAGVVKCWGSNFYGQLGDWTRIDRLTPGDVIFPDFGFMPLALRNFHMDFFDDFGDPGSGWFAGEDDELLAEYLNGEYRVLVKPAQASYAFTAPTSHWQNYTVEVDARWHGNPGASYGLIFGIVGDYDQFYSFEVNTDFRVFALFRYDASGWTTLAPITEAYAIQPGTATNHLRIIIYENSGIAVEINGSQRGVWFDSNISGETGTGLIVSTYSDLPNADARFDNFKITSTPLLGSPPGLTALDPAITTGQDLPPVNEALDRWISKALFSRLPSKDGWR